MVSPTSGMEQDFSSPVIYTVTAADGSTKEYTVTVTEAASDAKDITDFVILGVHGTIGTDTISLIVPYGTNLASLTPTITHTGASVFPGSGITHNFTDPVVYTVTADDGSIKYYTVTVAVASNNAKNITDFTILGIHGVIGPDTISITVPFGTNLTSLTPTITHTGSSVNPASGVPHNFTSPVVYTVTAADSSTKNYTVTATVDVDDRWTRLSGVYGKSTQGNGVATDSSGNVYVAGLTNGNLDGETLTGANAVFVIKYNSSGVKQWTRLMSGTGSYNGRAITVDYNDDVYVTGSASGLLDGQTVPGSSGTFIVKYNPSGVKQWTRVLGANGKIVTANAITTDFSGNIYVTGLSSGSLDGQILAGSSGAFVIKYDSSGNKLWTRLSSGSGTASATGYGIVADSNDNIYVSGGATGTLDGQTVVGSSAAFLIKYDSSGIKQWTRLSGTSGLTYGNSAAVDSSNNIYFTGWTQGNLDGQTLIGTRGAFIIKYDSSGVKQWTRLSGVTGKETMGRGVVVGSTDNVYLAGWTQGDLDGQTFIGVTNGYNAFLIQYNTAGVKQWTYLLGSVGCFAEGRSVAVDLNENVYVAGYSYGNLDGQLSSGSSDVFVSSRLTP